MSGCIAPWGPSTAAGPVVGTLAPLVVDGVPQPSASVRTREVCSRYAQTVTVRIEHNEHPVEILLDHNYPLTQDLPATVPPGGGSVVLDTRDECWTMVITHVDLGTTGDDLDYRIDWVMTGA